MTQDIIDHMLANTYTQTDALRRIGMLKDIVVAKIFAATRPGPDYQDPWLNLLNPKILQYFTKDNVYKLFDEIKGEIKKIEPLVVRLPFEIPEAELADLGSRLRKSYGKNFLVEIKYDPSLIAGAHFSFKGVYKDYSIRQEIADNRQAIIGMLKNYTHK